MTKSTLYKYGKYKIYGIYTGRGKTIHYKYGMDVTKKTTYCINTVFLEIQYYYSIYSINMAIVLMWALTYTRVLYERSIRTVSSLRL